jgi:hypothetical protein
MFISDSDQGNCKDYKSECLFSVQLEFIFKSEIKNCRNGEGGGGTTTRGTTVAKLKFRLLCQLCSGGCQEASQREASRPKAKTAY